MRRRSVLQMCGAALAVGLPGARAAPAGGKIVRVGVLTDMAGPFADQVGPGSVLAAHMAAEDFTPESGDLTVDIMEADHQNKPDIGSQIARHWIDAADMGAIVDLPNSGVALAVSQVVRDKGRVLLASSSATSDLTGKFCGPHVVQWVLDTWGQGHACAAALVAGGAKTWFFITVDYALGHALKRDAAAAVQALGGQVLGEALHPLGTADLSAQLLAAQASGAQAIALANTGADMINAVKQAGEFGLLHGDTRIAALFAQSSDIHALGLQAAAGLLVAEAFYWDQTDATRAWSRRFAARRGGRMPTEDQAGVYSATLAYLRAVRDAGTQDGPAVVAQMKRAPFDDALFGHVSIRHDGRTLHPMYLFRVKTPAASTGEWDLYETVQTIPAEAAFRPLDQGGCTL